MLSLQRVDMHKEKVSRREIGSLTVSKRFPSYQKIVPPPQPTLPGALLQETPQLQCPG